MASLGMVIISGWWDLVDDKVYTYTRDGVYTPSEDFDLHASNSSPTGITWNGTHLAVVQSGAAHVYKYTPQGDYVSRFALTEENSNSSGIVWYRPSQLFFCA